MKNVTKSLFLVFIALAAINTSCTKEEAVNNGEPVVKYVRVTRPESSDSLLVGATQGKLIAIMGENLQDANAVWFNDQQAFLTSTYITNTTILVRVPSDIPVKITNQIKIYFSNGDSLLYNFQVEISEPYVKSMVCEYVLPGQIATIKGDYFYKPLQVHFSGGAEGEIISVTENMIEVRVPVGAEPGQITVSTNFGSTESNFWFRDNRNIFISSDPYTGWWDASFVVENPGPEDPPSINGNYIRVNQPIGSWQWTTVAGGPPSAMGAISKNIPDEAILNPSNYNLKFELNTMKPYDNNVIKLNIGLTYWDNSNYLWKPPYDTKGKWQTITIPFNEIADSYGTPLVLSADGYYTRLLFHGGGALDCDMSFDNFRIVPKYIK